MKRDLEIAAFPAGALVRTPTGRIGVVQKSRGQHSKRDYFERVCVWWGPGVRDGVVLQPHLLQLFSFIPE